MLSLTETTWKETSLPIKLGAKEASESRDTGEPLEGNPSEGK